MTPVCLRPGSEARRHPCWWPPSCRAGQPGLLLWWHPDLPRPGLSAFTLEPKGKPRGRGAPPIQTEDSFSKQPAITVTDARGTQEQEGDPVPRAVHRSLSQMAPWPDISLPQRPPRAAWHTLTWGQVQPDPREAMNTSPGPGLWWGDHSRRPLVLPSTHSNPRLPRPPW